MIDFIVIRHQGAKKQVIVKEFSWDAMEAEARYDAIEKLVKELEQESPEAEVEVVTALDRQQLQRTNPWVEI